MKLKHIVLIVLGLALGGLLVRFGAVAVSAAALPLLKYVLPFAAAYVGLRFLRTKLQQLAQGDQHRPTRRAEAIDLCPDCGEVKSAHHVCKQSPR